MYKSSRVMIVIIIGVLMFAGVGNAWREFGPPMEDPGRSRIEREPKETKKSKATITIIYNELTQPELVRLVELITRNHQEKACKLDIKIGLIENQDSLDIADSWTINNIANSLGDILAISLNEIKRSQANEK